MTPRGPSQMKTRLWGVAALALALAAAGQAIAFDMPVDPQSIDGGAAFAWRVRPTVMDRSLMASDLGNPHGWAAVECVIGGNGHPGKCGVVSEHPTGQNVGKMIAGFASLYKAMSKDAAGQSTVGRRVKFVDGVGAEKDL